MDEAGMLDQDTALALFTITMEAGASVALVGDRAQLPAVGRGGVLDMAAHICGTTFDMTGVHRFTDPDYADLTLRMRDGTNPEDVFDQLHDLGLVRLHDTEQAVHEHIATHADSPAGTSVAVTVATNDEARTLNERIRAERVERGQVDDTRTAVGSDRLAIGVGDVIQTRKNDRDLRVANRQTWTVQHIDRDGTLWAKEAVPGTGRKRPHIVALPADYVTRHVHLAYAATAYGVQGATVSRSHTILSDAVTSAAVYVGMTRGRETNTLHVVAEDVADAREQFTAALERDRADRGLADATQRAHDAIGGLVDHGPVRLVNTELVALERHAEHAQHQATRWVRMAERLDAQAATHRAEVEASDATLEAAGEHAAEVLAAVTAPLVARAENDGRDYLAAIEDVVDAHALSAAAGRLRRPRAEGDYQTARDRAGTLKDRVRGEWGTCPGNVGVLGEWATRAAAHRAERDPDVIEAREALGDAKKAREGMVVRQRRERRAPLEQVYGPENMHRDPIRYDPRREAAYWQAAADKTRAQADRLRGLPVLEAAQLIAAEHAAEAAPRAGAEHRRHVPAAAERPSSRKDPQLHAPVPEL